MDARIYLVIVPLALLVFFWIRSRKKSSLIEERKTRLKSLYKREAVYLCDAVEDLGNNLIQFYGEAFGGSVRVGMKISDSSGVEYLIKEVYANDTTPDQPDSEIPNVMANSAIVIETKNFNWTSFRQNLKTEGVVALKLR